MPQLWHSYDCGAWGNLARGRLERRDASHGSWLKPCTPALTLSQREGAPLNWRPSAVADAGNGGPLNWPPSAHAVAGNGAPLNWRPSAVADAGNGPYGPPPTQSRQRGNVYGACTQPGSPVIGERADAG